MLVFEESREPEYFPGENLSELSREPTNSIHIIMALNQGINPGPHWWEASALTTVSVLLKLKQVEILKTNQKSCGNTLSMNPTAICPLFCPIPVSGMWVQMVLSVLWTLVNLYRLFKLRL